MPDESLTEKYGHLSPQDLRNWLLHEIADSAKAHELRVKEATEFVTAYAVGELTPDQALERLFQYEHRWGESLPGTHAADDSKNEQILAAIDRTRGKFTPLRELNEDFQKRFGKREERGGPSRQERG
jgi:hypothetical protein